VMSALRLMQWSPQRHVLSTNATTAYARGGSTE
jgi:hypothetical protein